jgi:Protein of unknown function (DUF3263)
VRAFSPRVATVDAPAHVFHDEADRQFAGIDPSIAADAAAIIAESTLSEDHQAILDFERRWWRQAGAKEQAIRDAFEMSPTRYYQTLNALLDLPQAQSYDPMLVHRLQRLRSSVPRARRLS